MKKMSLVIVIIPLTIGMLFLSCKKSDRDSDTTTYTSEDVAFATNLFYTVFKTVHQAANYSQGIVSSTSINSTTVFNCDTITVDTLSSPKLLNINFNTNCTSGGIVRNGSLTASINGYYDSPGAVTTISVNNFTYNDVTVFSGTISYQYLGLIESYPAYSITFNELKIVNKYNQKIFFSGNHQLQIIIGDSTPEISDDIYSISGSNTGMAFKGNSFSSQITTKLNLSGNCNWISSGIVTVVPNNKPSRILNFGNGCDNKITVSVYENNYELEIP